MANFNPHQSALQKQLAALASHAKAKSNVTAANRTPCPSLLFDERTAKGIDRTTLHSLGLNGLAELRRIDKRFDQFEGSLFAEEAARTERELQSKEQNEALDGLIARFLRLCAPHFMSKAVHKTIEYLLRVCRIDLYNADELIGAALPYHSSELFGRILLLLNTQALKLWRFLPSLKKKDNVRGVTRQLIAERCALDATLMRYICQQAEDAVKHSTAWSGLFSFYSVMTMEALSAACYDTSALEEVVKCITPFLLRGVRSSQSPHYQIASYMIISHLSSQQTLSAVMVDTLVPAIVHGCDADESFSAAIFALQCLCKTQGLQTLPPSAIRSLMSQRRVTQLKSALEADNVGTAFLRATARGLCALSNDLKSAMKLLKTLVRFEPKRARDRADMESISREVAEELLKRASQALLEKKKKLLLELSSVLREVSNRRTEALGRAVEAVLTDKEAQCRSTAFLEYVSSEFTSPQHLPLLSVAESDTSVHAEMRVQSIGGEVMEGGNGESAAVKTVQSCLIHHSGVVRGRAIEYLSEVEIADDSTREFVQTALLRGLEDDDLEVVFTALKGLRKQKSSLSLCDSYSSFCVILDALAEVMERVPRRKVITAAFRLLLSLHVGEDENVDISSLAEQKRISLCCDYLLVSSPRFYRLTQLILRKMAVFGGVFRGMEQLADDLDTISDEFDRNHDDSGDEKEAKKLTVLNQAIISHISMQLLSGENEGQSPKRRRKSKKKLSETATETKKDYLGVLLVLSGIREARANDKHVNNDDSESILAHVNSVVLCTGSIIEAIRRCEDDSKTRHLLCDAMRLVLGRLCGSFRGANSLLSSLDKARVSRCIAVGKSDTPTAALALQARAGASLFIKQQLAVSIVVCLCQYTNVDALRSLTVSGAAASPVALAVAHNRSAGLVRLLTSLPAADQWRSLLSAFLMRVLCSTGEEEDGASGLEWLLCSIALDVSASSSSRVRCLMLLAAHITARGSVAGDGSSSSASPTKRRRKKKEAENTQRAEESSRLGLMCALLLSLLAAPTRPLRQAALQCMEALRCTRIAGCLPLVTTSSTPLPRVHDSVAMVVGWSGGAEDGNDALRAPAGAAALMRATAIAAQHRTRLAVDGYALSALLEEEEEGDILQTLVTTVTAFAIAMLPCAEAAGDMEEDDCLPSGGAVALSLLCLSWPLPASPVLTYTAHVSSVLTRLWSTQVHSAEGEGEGEVQISLSDGNSSAWLLLALSVLRWRLVDLSLWRRDGLLTDEADTSTVHTLCDMLSRRHPPRGLNGRYLPLLQHLQARQPPILLASPRLLAAQAMRATPLLYSALPIPLQCMLLHHMVRSTVHNQGDHDEVFACLEEWRMQPALVVALLQLRHHDDREGEGEEMALLEEHLCGVYVVLQVLYSGLDRRWQERKEIFRNTDVCTAILELVRRCAALPDDSSNTNKNKKKKNLPSCSPAYADLSDAPRVCQLALHVLVRAMEKAVAEADELEQQARADGDAAMEEAAETTTNHVLASLSTALDLQLIGAWIAQTRSPLLAQGALALLAAGVALLPDAVLGDTVPLCLSLRRHTHTVSSDDASRLSLSAASPNLFLLARLTENILPRVLSSPQQRQRVLWEALTGLLGCAVQRSAVTPQQPHQFSYLLPSTERERAVTSMVRSVGATSLYVVQAALFCAVVTKDADSKATVLSAADARRVVDVWTRLTPPLPVTAAMASYAALLEVCVALQQHAPAAGAKRAKRTRTNNQSEDDTPLPVELDADQQWLLQKLRIDLSLPLLRRQLALVTLQVLRQLLYDDDFVARNQRAVLEQTARQSGEDGSSAAQIPQQYTRLYHSVITVFRCLSGTMDALPLLADDDSGSTSVEEHFSSVCVDIVHVLGEIMPISSFCAVLHLLLRCDDAAMQRQALLLLNQRVEEETAALHHFNAVTARKETLSKRAEAERRSIKQRAQHLMALVPLLCSIVQEHRDNGLNVQTALLSLEILVRSFGAIAPDVFLRNVDTVVSCVVSGGSRDKARKITKKRRKVQLEEKGEKEEETNAADAAVLSSAFICLAAFCAHLGPAMLQPLTRFFPAMLRQLGSSAPQQQPPASQKHRTKRRRREDSVDDGTDDSAADDEGEEEPQHQSALLCAGLSAIDLILQSMSAFISPYLTDIIALITRNDVAVSQDPQLVPLCNRLRKTLVAHTEARLLLPALTGMYGAMLQQALQRANTMRRSAAAPQQKQVKGGDARKRSRVDQAGEGDGGEGGEGDDASAPLRVLLECVSQCCGAMPRRAAAAHSTKLHRFFLHVFEVRHAAGLRNSALLRLDAVEERALQAFEQWVLKLDEGLFRPLFVKLVDWSTCTLNAAQLQRGECSITRLMLFLRLVTRLSELLQTLFTPFFSFVLSGCCRLLANADALLQCAVEGAPKWKAAVLRAQCDAVQQRVLEALRSCFAHCPAAFLSAERLKALIDPLANQVAYGPEHTHYETRMDVLAECAAALCSKARQEAFWKPFNHALLLHTRAELPLVRYSALRCVRAMYTAVGEELLVCLPESIPFIAELLEDSDERVAALTQDTITDVDVLLGQESVADYL